MSRSTTAPLWLHLRSGPFVLLYAAIAIALVVLGYVPLVSREVLAAVAEPAVTGVALLAIGVRVLRLTGGPERRFWLLVGAAHLTYLSTYTFIVDWKAPGGQLLGLLEDFLHLLFYGAMFLAIATNPHRWRAKGTGLPIGRIETIATVVFSFGLLAYFVAVPGTLGTDGTESFAPQLLVYALLDLLLVIALLYLRRICGSARWRSVYGLLALMAGIWTALDFFEAILWLGLVADPESWLVDSLWFLPHMGTILAVRASELDADSAPAVPEAGQFGVNSSIALYIAFLPAMHFGSYAAGVLDPAVRSARELILLVSLAVLAWLGLLARRRQDAERKRLEDRIHNAQKMEAIGRLAGSVAHDFNNLLTVISASSELALDRLGPDDAVRPDVANIADAARRARSLTQQMLAISRQQPLGARVVDLAEIVPAVCRLLQPVLAAGVRLDFEPGTGPCRVRVDREKIERLLFNLAVNANDAMPDGGRIVITTEVERGIGPSETGRPRAWAVVAVRDTGLGMDEETRAKAFDPFFTTKPSGRGTGLGLTTAYATAKQHGGEIVITSGVGAGTTMTLYLPLVEAAAEPAAPETPAPGIAAAGSETVLVVEDEPAVRGVVCDHLQHSGYRVLEAQSAEAAVEVFREHGESVALLLSDVVLPGMTGPELYRELERSRPGLRVLLMTGYSPGELFEPGEPRPPLITKPFNGRELCARVRQALDAESATLRSVPPLRRDASA